MSGHVPPSATHVQVREVGDGNINFVFILEGPGGALCVKQGHAYVRIMKSWALTQVPRDVHSSRQSSGASRIVRVRFAVLVLPQLRHKLQRVCDITSTGIG